MRHSRGLKMAQTYGQRSLLVLSLLGILSAIMCVLSVILLFQLQSPQLAKTSAPPPGSAAAAVPAPVWAVLMPVSTVFSALSLTLHLSSAVVCLLHGYFSTEACRGEQDTHRADWFLLDSRGIRHVAIGLFCLGVSVYLAAMSVYMLLIFEVETGIASACVLSSGILILMIIVIHTLIKASHASKRYHDDHLDTLYRNEHGSTNTPLARPCELKIGVDQPRMHGSQLHLQRQISYSSCHNPKLQEHAHHHQQYSPSAGSLGHSADKDVYGSGGRMHRTLSTDSGLLQPQTKPWNGVNNEMRSVLARKTGISAKDSTLV